MQDSLRLVIASGLYKVTPLLVGLVVVYQAGESYYSELGYYFVFANFFSSLLGAGVVPVFVRETARSKRLALTLCRFAFFVFAATAVFSILAIGFWCLGGLQCRNLSVMLALGVATGINGLLIPILCLNDRSRFVLLANLMYCILGLAFAWTSAFLPFASYQYLYSSTSLSLAAVLGCGVWYCFRSEFNSFSITTVPILGSIWSVVVEVSAVYVPNVLWMAAVFGFHHVVHGRFGESGEYAWFVLGFQCFSILVFLPNSLSPVMLKSFSMTKEDEAIHASFKIAGVFFVVGAVVLGAAYALTLASASGIPVVGIHTVCVTCSAGVFASAIAPLSNYLVSQNSSWCIGATSVVWIIFAVFGLTLCPTSPHVVFSLSYLAALVTMIMMSLWVGKRLGFGMLFR